VFTAERERLRLSAWDFLSQPDVPLRLYLLERTTGNSSGRITLRILDETGWVDWLAVVGGVFPEPLSEERAGMRSFKPDANAVDRLTGELAVGNSTWAFMAPRGVGLTAWSGDPKRSARIRRRFMLVGQTVDGMRVWDIRRAVQTLQSVPATASPEIALQTEGQMAVNALYAALFEQAVREVKLAELPESHLAGPDYLGVLRVTDIPEVLAAVSAEKTVTATR
jgi:hypothetical protein